MNDQHKQGFICGTKKITVKHQTINIVWKMDAQSEYIICRCSFVSNMKVTAKNSKPLLCKAVWGKSFKISLFSVSGLGVILLHL